MMRRQKLSLEMRKMKQVIHVFSWFLLWIFSSNAFAYVYWNYTGVNHSWNYAANWGGSIPTSSSDPMMRGQGTGYSAVIDSSVAALGRTMYVGNTGRADLDITGGSLTLEGLRLGQSGT